MAINKAEVSKINDELLARRDALRKMGLFAAYSTPVVLGVLTSRKAMAASAGNNGNNGYGNGGNDGVPGNSGFPDIFR
jgi:hypothetical protein